MRFKKNLMMCVDPEHLWGSGVGWGVCREERTVNLGISTIKKEQHSCRKCERAAKLTLENDFQIDLGN